MLSLAPHPPGTPGPEEESREPLPEEPSKAFPRQAAVLSLFPLRY
jgi:hypothetical protein